MIDQYQYQLVVPWRSEQGSVWWNETCAMVLEFFGLPGDCFVYKPYMDYMTFSFRSNEDLTLCKVLLSGRY